jgi:hypothetical protein
MSGSVEEEGVGLEAARRAMAQDADPAIPRRKFLAILLFVASGVLQVGILAYVSHMSPHARHVQGFAGWSLAPYVVAAGIWLPWWNRLAAAGGVVVAALLLPWTVVANLPLLRYPSQQGGDMAGAGVLVDALYGCFAVLILSLIVFAILVWRRMREIQAGG